MIRFAKEADQEVFADYILRDFDAQLNLNLNAGQVAKPLSFKHDGYETTFVTEYNEPQAFVGLSYSPLSNTAYIKHVFVAEPYRGNGLGEKLLRFAVDYCFREWPQIRHVYSFTVEGNETSDNLHKKLGFEDGGFYKDFLADGKGQRIWIKRP